MHVPLLDLKKQYQGIKKEIDQAVQGVLDSGAFILGENVQSLEKEIAFFLGVGFAVGLASGTDALELPLRAFGIKSGDEVITTPFTFIATAEAICLVGANPVFCDIRPDDYTIDVKEVRKKITKKTKAIIPVHLYGHPCCMNELSEVAKEYDLKVIEDCAQAIGSEYRDKKVGSFGDCGAFSFFPSKNLGAYGDGGIAVTNNKELADKIRILRMHGAIDKYRHSFQGRNSRLDELQAAILRVKLKYLDKWNESRRNNAAIYNKLFLKSGLEKNLVLPKELPNCKHTYHVYAIKSGQRDKLQEFLKEQGVTTLMHYPVPIHLEEVYKYLGYKKGDFPNAELAASGVLSLPMYPELKTEEIEYIVKKIAEFFKNWS